MAVTPKICIQYEADASKITIKDKTGVYTENNEGGYGTPNADRNTLAGVLLVYYQAYDSDEKLLTLLEDTVRFDDSYTNEEESKFIVSFHKDGWYKYIYTLVPTSITPAEGRIIYNTSTEDLRQYDEDLNLVEVYDVSKLDDNNIYSTVKVEEIPVPKLSIKKNKLSRDFFTCKQCIECDCKKEWDEVLYLREGIQSLKSRFSVVPLEAQKMVERLTKQYKIK